MKRVDLLKELDQLLPALSSTGVKPIESCFYFHKGRVSAFGGTLGISKKLDVPWEFAVPGQVLYNLLSASRAADVELDQEASSETEAAFKLGKTKIKLAKVVGEVVTRPAIVPSPIIAGQDFFGGLEKVSGNMGDFTANPELSGVVIDFKKKATTLYASDNVTLVRVTAEGANEEFCGVIPPITVRALLRVKEETAKISCTEYYARFDFASGLVVFTTLLVSDPQEFAKVITDLGVDDAPKGCPIPKAFGHALRRAAALSGEKFTKPEDRFTELTLESEVGKLHTKTQLGEVHDKVQLPDLPDVTLKFDVALVQRSLGNIEHLSFFETHVLGRSKGYDLIVSTIR